MIGYVLALRLAPSNRLAEHGAMLVEANELIAISEFQFSTPLLTLEAIRNNRDKCAICLLESELELEADQLRELQANATLEGKKAATERLASVDRHFERFPFDRESCRGICRE